ncbi:MAG: hypothetical protein WKF97_23525 [Chitinophagaceae bacterium]
MTEKVVINGKDVWIVVEPITVPRDNPDDIPTEYFMAFYNFEEPGSKPDELFREGDNRPILFESPVAALEYANEKLLEML